MRKNKKKEPEIVSSLEIQLMNNGKFEYTIKNIHGWALTTFVQLFLKALAAPKVG